MPVLSLTGNYAEKILSYYLWGQETPPAPDEIANSRFIDLRSKTFTIDVDAQQYMDKVGHNIALAEQVMFQRFFNNKTRDDRNVTLAMIQQAGKGNTSPNANEIMLTHRQFVDLFYTDGNGKPHKRYPDANSGNLNSTQYTTDTGSSDYWQRAFVFGSTQLKMDTERVKYVFDATTGKALRIDDIYVMPENDQFDFDSDDGTAKEINPILKQVMDPSEIGKEVEISYINNQYFKLNSGSFSLAEYRAYVNDPGAHYPETPDSNLFAFFKGFKTLKNSGAFDHLDDQGRVVIFGSKDSDSIAGYQAKNLNMDAPVDLSSLNNPKHGNALVDWITTNIFGGYFNHFKKYLSNGIVYVGGEKDDLVTGTEYNDKLIGDSGQDTLIGGEGDDIFVVQGQDLPSIYDTFFGNEGTDSILGGDNNDIIRARNLKKDTHSIEVIDGGDGENVLAGTEESNVIDLTGTKVKNIHRIELGGGADQILLNKNSISDLSGITIDGGDDLDWVEGSKQADDIDLTQITLTNIEDVFLGKGNDTVKASISVNGPENYYGGDDNDSIDGRNAERGLKLYGESGNDTLYGGDKKDTLEGGEGKDLLLGGKGEDEYHAGDGDIIKDSTGDGSVLFDMLKLTGGEQEKEGSIKYTGNSGETYFWEGPGKDLRIENNKQSITIRNFSSGNLGITLKSKEPPTPPDDKDLPIPPPPPDPPRPRGGDPLILDLDGNGIATTGLAAGIHFDHDGDGFRELSGFITADNGFLVLDRNEDGKINDGTELFGDSTRLLDGTVAADGFAALAEMDDDKDGVIDRDDAIFDKLRIFQDFNQNGIADDGELFSLAEKKIAGLNLAYDQSPHVDKFGNLHRQMGSFIMESGASGTMTDVVFTMDRTRTTADMLPVPQDIAALPDAKGYGTTYDLYQAMV